MKYVSRPRWLANPNKGRSQFPHNFQSSYELLICCQSEDYCAHQSDIQVPQVMLTGELGMVVICRACGPISYEHMLFWNMFSESDLTIFPLKYMCPIKTSNQIRHVLPYSCGLKLKLIQFLVLKWYEYTLKRT